MKPVVIIRLPVVIMTTVKKLKRTGHCTIKSYKLAGMQQT